MKTKLSIPGVSVTSVCTVTPGNPNNEYTYRLSPTGETIYYKLSDKSFQLSDAEDGDSANPVQDLFELASLSTQPVQLNEAINRFLCRYGTLDESETISQREVLKIANHIGNLACLLSGKVKKNDYYDLIKRTFALFINGKDNYPLFSYIDCSTEEDDLLCERSDEIQQARLEMTANAIQETINDALLVASTTSGKGTEALPLDLLFLDAVYKLMPFYFSKDREIVFNHSFNNSALTKYDKEHPGGESIETIIDRFVSQCITDDINQVIQCMKFSYNTLGEIQPQIASIRQAIYYSFTALDCQQYGYYPCSNPRCRRYVLRAHPLGSSTNTVNQSYSDKMSNRFCCKKCGMRYAQNRWRYKHKPSSR